MCKGRNALKARRARPLTILVVGQTPPPLGGQAEMIRLMLGGDFGPDVTLRHVRMKFSKDMNEVGKFKGSKVTELLFLIARIVVARVRYDAKVLYYPPAPPRRIPVIRDIIILSLTRWMFLKTIFHMHAGGLTEIVGESSRIFKWFFWRAYGRPAVVIRPSAHNPDDGKVLMAAHDYVVPNGILDPFLNRPEPSEPGNRPVVLFVGLISESKGVSIALDACRRVLPEVPNVLFKFMGRFESKEYEVEVGRTIEEYGINENVVFLGEQTGRSKWESFSSAWVFCYPTYFEAESFGLVVAEAMALGIPVVASRWRGVQSLVVDGETGYLVPVRDARTLAQCLTQVLLNHELRAAMGAAGRQRFLDEFSLNNFYQSMATIFRSLR